MKNILLTMTLALGLALSAFAQTDSTDIGGSAERAMSMYALDTKDIGPMKQSTGGSTQEGSLTYAYDFGLRESAVVGTKSIGKLHNVFNLKFDLDVDGFLGASTRSKTPVGGFFVGKRGKISQEASGYLGVGLSWPQGVQSPNFAVGAGVSWRF